MQPISRFSLLFSILLSGGGLIGCAPTIAAYDQYSYTQATSIKVDALNVVAKATGDYSSHQ
jgi:uncharacterized protein affecting Mg2+/Co2+ transport